MRAGALTLRYYVRPLQGQDRERGLPSGHDLTVGREAGTHDVVRVTCDSPRFADNSGAFAVDARPRTEDIPSVPVARDGKREDITRLPVARDDDREDILRLRVDILRPYVDILRPYVDILRPNVAPEAVREDISAKNVDGPAANVDIFPANVAILRLPNAPKPPYLQPQTKKGPRSSKNRQSDPFLSFLSQLGGFNVWFRSSSLRSLCQHKSQR